LSSFAAPPLLLSWEIERLELMLQRCSNGWLSSRSAAALVTFFVVIMRIAG
jgi:hypothetical protein